jgi:murein DD-endopeptidase MepM/ murein hydrolase activator NlpD
MPIGTILIASRAGTVTRIFDSYFDNTGIPGEENVVGIAHDDGSVALYFHLAENGAMVAMQQVVNKGDVIALSGNSGNSTEPHLHFIVDGPPGTGGVGTVPITFSNTDPHPNGLVGGQLYEAL